MNDWTPQAPFSLEFSKECAREMTRNIARRRMNEAARRWEIREFAEVVKEVMRKERVQ